MPSLQPPEDDDKGPTIAQRERQARVGTTPLPTQRLVILSDEKAKQPWGTTKDAGTDAAAARTRARTTETSAALCPVYTVASRAISAALVCKINHLVRMLDRCSCVMREANGCCNTMATATRIRTMMTSSAPRPVRQSEPRTHAIFITLRVLDQCFCTAASVRDDNIYAATSRM